MKPAIILLSLCLPIAWASAQPIAKPALDPARDLPRLPAVEPTDAVATWKVRAGFAIQLAAHEPRVRAPVALCFDENGRMFVCEMLDYPESRDLKPHLGRISLLEDKDGDGFYETSTVFADDLAWPTGLIWANGGLYVCATPDIWRFADKDGDGKAEVREKVFTGFGPGNNVDALMNSLQWGQDNRIHLAAGLAPRGKVSCAKRPDLPAQELGGRDFWFDPRTYEFGLEAGGAQHGMSFDNYGRKFGCENSDHLQFWVYDERYAARNPFFSMPAPRRSIAADGGAAEVFRISPDEPWRIVRTRWRIGGVAKGPIEGGGRVSGYFTGATGTTVYRGDAYGPGFVNNTFTGDAGGQLVHRKIISADGASLLGKRAEDEQDAEFAASRDTWMRPVNFANAPDGCLHIADMYREVIEAPFTIPDEIRKHLDFTSGSDRGRIYRIVPDHAAWTRRGQVALGKASIAELVRTLEHPNGWHRDTASRLLHERQNQAAAPMLAQLVRESAHPLARLHALGVLDGLGALDASTLTTALSDADAHVRERGVLLFEKEFVRGKSGAPLLEKLAALADDANDRVRLQLAFTLGTVLKTDAADVSRVLAPAYVQLAKRDHGHAWIAPALLSAPPEVVIRTLFEPMTGDPQWVKEAALFVADLIQIRAGSDPQQGAAACIRFIAAQPLNLRWLRALGTGLHHAGATIEKADTEGKLTALFDRAAATAGDASAARLEAIELLGFASPRQSNPPLMAALAQGQPDAIQAAAIKTLSQSSSAAITKALLDHWPHYGRQAKEAMLTACIAHRDRTKDLLAVIRSGAISSTSLTAAQVQSLVQHKDATIATLAKSALAAVIPPSRAEVTARFQPALALKGDAARGLAVYQQRCLACHRAAEQGLPLGPDLITVKSKGRDGLLTAVLDPNKEVLPQYIAYTVTTKSGETLTGFIIKDDSTGVTFRMAGGIEQTLQRSQIKSTTATGQSLMPEGLETGLEVQGMADLLTFIEELK